MIMNSSKKNYQTSPEQFQIKSQSQKSASTKTLEAADKSFIRGGPGIAISNPQSINVPISQIQTSQSNTLNSAFSNTNQSQFRFSSITEEGQNIMNSQIKTKIQQSRQKQQCSSSQINSRSLGLSMTEINNSNTVHFYSSIYIMKQIQQQDLNLQQTLEKVNNTIEEQHQQQNQQLSKLNKRNWIEKIDQPLKKIDKTAQSVKQFYNHQMLQMITPFMSINPSPNPKCFQYIPLNKEEKTEKQSKIKNLNSLMIQFCKQQNYSQEQIQNLLLIQQINFILSTKNIQQLTEQQINNIQQKFLKVNIIINQSRHRAEILESKHIFYSKLFLQNKNKDTQKRQVYRKKLIELKQQFQKLIQDDVPCPDQSKLFSNCYKRVFQSENTHLHKMQIKKPSQYKNQQFQFLNCYLSIINILSLYYHCQKMSEQLIQIVNEAQKYIQERKFYQSQDYAALFQCRGTHYQKTNQIQLAISSYLKCLRIFRQNNFTPDQKNKFKGSLLLQYFDAKRKMFNKIYQISYNNSVLRIGMILLKHREDKDILSIVEQNTYVSKQYFQLFALNMILKPSKQQMNQKYQEENKYKINFVNSLFQLRKQNIQNNGRQAQQQQQVQNLKSQMQYILQNLLNPYHKDRKIYKLADYSQITNYYSELLSHFSCKNKKQSTSSIQSIQPVQQIQSPIAIQFIESAQSFEHISFMQLISQFQQRKAKQQQRKQSNISEQIQQYKKLILFIFLMDWKRINYINNNCNNAKVKLISDSLRIKTEMKIIDLNIQIKDWKKALQHPLQMFRINYAKSVSTQDILFQLKCMLIRIKLNQPMPQIKQTKRQLFYLIQSLQAKYFTNKIYYHEYASQNSIKIHENSPYDDNKGQVQLLKEDNFTQIQLKILKLQINLLVSQATIDWEEKILLFQEAIISFENDIYEVQFYNKLEQINVLYYFGQICFQKRKYSRAAAYFQTVVDLLEQNVQQSKQVNQNQIFIINRSGSKSKQDQSSKIQISIIRESTNHYFDQKQHNMSLALMYCNIKMFFAVFFLYCPNNQLQNAQKQIFECQNIKFYQNTKLDRQFSEIRQFYSKMIKKEIRRKERNYKFRVKINKEMFDT